MTRKDFELLANTLVDIQARLCLNYDENRTQCVMSRVAKFADIWEPLVDALDGAYGNFNREKFVDYVVRGLEKRGIRVDGLALLTTGGE